MTDAKKRSDEDTTKAAQEFLELIYLAARRLDIQPRLTVNLFGVFARHVVTLLVDDGHEPAEAHVAVVAAFTKGMGVEMIAKKADGEEAEQMRAEFERANQASPLQ